MLKERVLTAIFGGSALLLAIYMGGNYALTVTLLILSVAAYEIADIAGLRSSQKLLTVFLNLLAFYFCTKNAYFYAAFILLPILAFKIKNEKVNAYPYFFSVYTSFAFSRFYFYAKQEFSLVPIIYLLVLTWSNDTVAYFAGLNLGRIKIAPSVSPNKTLEGTLAGMLAGTIAFIATTRLLGSDFNTLNAIIMGLVLSLSAFFGDLLESHYKRTYGVKDSGKILPGHGGVLDRFDSLMTVLIVYSLIKF